MNSGKIWNKSEVLQHRKFRYNKPLTITILTGKYSRFDKSGARHGFIPPCLKAYGGLQPFLTPVLKNLNVLFWILQYMCGEYIYESKTRIYLK